MKKYPFYFLFSVVILFSACSNSNKEANDQGKDSTAQTLDTTLTKTDQAVDLDTTDVSFFENVAYGGMIEVESSNKIIQSTKDSEIRAFAEMMVKDHGDANNRLKTLAQNKGYRLPTLLPASKMELITKMTTLKDEGRDEYYMLLMAGEHQKAIDLFSNASRSKDAEISKFATDLLPTLKNHYQQTLRIDTMLRAKKANQGDDPLKLSDRKKK